MSFILAALDPSILTAGIAAVLGGGFAGGVAVWRKAGPEADQIVAKTLIEVNEHLRKELALRDEEIDRLRKRLRELRRDFDALEDEFHKLARKKTDPSPSG